MKINKGCNIIMDALTRVQVARVILAKKIYLRKGCLILPPQDIVKKAFSLSKAATVAFSGGKGSLAVLRMVLDVNPDALVMFNNTGVEHPLTVKYVHELRDKWGFQLIETQPIMTFWQCAEKYGFPQIRSGKASRASATKKNTKSPACCRYLKLIPAKKAYKDNHVDLIFTGIQAGESRPRFQTAYQLGQYFYSKKWLASKCNPITFWTDEELWAYLKSNSLPTNPLYDRGFKRVGCLPCTGYVSWQRQMAKTNPKLLKFILKKQGQPGLDEWLLGRFSQPPCEGGPLNDQSEYNATLENEPDGSIY
jgi:phosphoadenosine phosphosulfate reductase